MRSARAVFFDLRGTLVDPDTGWRLSDRERVGFVRSLGARESEQALHDLLRRAVVDVNKETFSRRHWFDQDRLVLERFALLAGVEADLAAIDAFESWRNRAFERMLCAYPDAAPTLRALRARSVPVGCVADARADWARRLLARTGLLALLDVVVASEESGEVKATGAALRLACARAALEPTDVIFVGDRLDKDVAMARAAGAQPVLLDRSGDRPGPGAINSLTEVLAWNVEPRRESLRWSTSTTSS